MKIFKLIIISCFSIFLLWCICWLVKGGNWHESRVDLQLTFSRLVNNTNTDFQTAFENCRYYFRQYVGTNWVNVRVLWNFTDFDSLSGFFKNIGVFFNCVGAFLNLCFGFIIFICRGVTEFILAYFNLIFNIFDFIVNPVVVEFNSWY